MILSDENIEANQMVINYTRLVHQGREFCLHCSPKMIWYHYHRLQKLKRKLKLYTDILYNAVYPYTVRDLL